MMEWLIITLLLIIILLLVLRIKNLKKQELYFSRVIDQHVSEVESMYTHMRGIRHDYKNQLQV